MPLTLTLDDVSAALLTQEAARRHLPPETLLSSLIHSTCPESKSPQFAVGRPYIVRTFHSGFQPAIDILKLNSFLDEEDADAFRIKVTAVAS